MRAIKNEQGREIRVLDLEQYLKMHYRIDLQWDGEDWIAKNPELHGCIADGKTTQEAVESLAISRKLWLESRLATNLEIPLPASAQD
jgi:antitoxin HicB